MNKTTKFLAFLIACLSTPFALAQDGLPLHWQLGGPKPQDFEVVVDEKVKHAGKTSTRIDFVGEQLTGFLSLAQTFKADAYRGKRVRLSAWVKTKSPDSHAQLWFRLDALKRMPGFDNMGNRPIKGITDWQKYDLVLDVPDDTVALVFGVLSLSQGTIWVDDFSLEIVGNDVAVTNTLSPEAMNQVRNNSGLANAKLPPQSLNLDFEGGANPIRTPVAIDPAIYAQLTGYYVSPNGALIIVALEAGKLTLDAGFRKNVIQPLSENEFFARGMAGSSTFVKDDKGNISELVIKTPAGEGHLKKLNLDEAKTRAAQILSAAYAAKGGLEKLKAIRDVQFDSMLTEGNGTVTNKLFLSSQLQFRREVGAENPGQTSLTVSDGKGVWIQRGGKTTTASPQQYLGWWQQIWWLFTLHTFPGKTVETLALGERELNGKPVDVVILLIDSYQYFLSFDQQTHLLSRSVQVGGDDVLYEDFRAVNGIQFPFKATINPNGQKGVVIMREYKLNVGIDAAKLVKP